MGKHVWAWCAALPPSISTDPLRHIAYPGRRHGRMHGNRDLFAWCVRTRDDCPHVFLVDLSISNPDNKIPGIQRNATGYMSTHPPTSRRTRPIAIVCTLDVNQVSQINIRGGKYSHGFSISIDTKATPIHLPLHFHIIIGITSLAYSKSRKKVML